MNGPLSSCSSRPKQQLMPGNQEKLYLNPSAKSLQFVEFWGMKWRARFSEQESDVIVSLFQRLLRVRNREPFSSQCHQLDLLQSWNSKLFFDGSWSPSKETRSTDKSGQFSTISPKADVLFFTQTRGAEVVLPVSNGRVPNSPYRALYDVSGCIGFNLFASCCVQPDVFNIWM